MTAAALILELTTLADALDGPGPSLTPLLVATVLRAIIRELTRGDDGRESGTAAGLARPVPGEAMRASGPR